MKNLTAISVQLDKKDKELANNILKRLGLNMNTYINMAIKQLIHADGLPFEVANPKPSKEFLKALKELEYMEKHPEQYKSYNNIKELKETLLLNNYYKL